MEKKIRNLPQGYWSFKETRWNESGAAIKPHRRAVFGNLLEFHLLTWAWQPAGGEEKLPAEDSDNYATVVARFHEYFQKWDPQLMLREKFWLHLKREPTQTFDSWVVTVKERAAECKFSADIYEQAVRDKLTFSCKEDNYKLKLYDEGAALSLEKAVKTLSLKEATKRELQESKTAEIERVTRRGNRPDPHSGQDTEQRNQRDSKRKAFQTSGRNCGHCNRRHPLERRTAQQRIHSKCNKMGHFPIICKSVPPKTVNEVLETEDDFSLTFVGGVTTPTCSNTSKAEPAANSQISKSDPGWHVKLKIQDQDTLTWCMDTGAQVSVMPEEKWRVHGPIAKYWSERGNISLHDGLLLRGRRIVIPPRLRADVLRRLHDGHQGITKTRANAASSVWWPGISQDITRVVRNCAMCEKYRRERIEPMKGTEFPEWPWSRVGIDFFQHKDKHYLLAVDYFSRDLEISQVSKNVNTAQTILQLKRIFSQYGIPDILFSDNGPQFDSREFTTFSTDWQFQHITSSPRYPQSNGEVERAVQTMKTVLNKSSDEYLALLNYRDTPLHHGYSPAQLSMGRKLRTRVPCHPDELKPETPDYDHIRRKEKEYRAKMKFDYDHRHKVVEGKELSPGDRVWIPDLKAEGTVIKQHESPRSVVIQTRNGQVRRNWRTTRRVFEGNPPVSPQNEGYYQGRLQAEYSGMKVVFLDLCFKLKAMFTFPIFKLYFFL